jgi:4-hydroxybenzoate polyprenyltransferase
VMKNDYTILLQLLLLLLHVIYLVHRRAISKSTYGKVLFFYTFETGGKNISNTQVWVTGTTTGIYLTGGGGGGGGRIRAKVPKVLLFIFFFFFFFFLKLCIGALLHVPELPSDNLLFFILTARSPSCPAYS